MVGTRVDDAAMSAYTSYLDSATWQETRARVILRARGWCEKCGNHPARMVHHLSYRRFGHEPDDDLLAMCHRCHQRTHRPKPPPQDGLW